MLCRAARCTIDILVTNAGVTAGHGPPLAWGIPPTVISLFKDRVGSRANGCRPAFRAWIKSGKADQAPIGSGAWSRYGWSHSDVQSQFLSRAFRTTPT
jgi:hypothetical protein